MTRNKLITNFLFFLIIGLISLPSCKHDSMVEIPDSDPQPISCDSIAVSFSSVIKPIIEQSCYNSCHDGEMPSGGILLDSYNTVKAVVDNERFFGAVAHEVGFLAMPLGADKLPDCEIAQIKSWIEDGALNN